MGESKRRRHRDPNYGKKRQPRLRIGISPVSGRPMVFLLMGHRSRGISPHNRFEDAQFEMRRCQEYLDSSPPSHWDKPFDEAFSEFIFKLNAEFDYPNDDGILGVMLPPPG